MIILKTYENFNEEDWWKKGTSDGNVVSQGTSEYHEDEYTNPDYDPDIDYVGDEEFIRQEIERESRETIEEVLQILSADGLSKEDIEKLFKEELEKFKPFSKR